MTARHVTTGVTLIVLVVLLVVMAVYGFNAATAPLPGTGKPSPTCTGAAKSVKTVLRRSEVQVSVFNASGRSGLAGATLEKVESAGFRAGNAGNAPDGARIKRVTVWTTEEDDPAAKLVALAFGKGTPVVVTTEDLGPGIDVLIGPRYRDLDPDAPRKLALPAPVETCVEVR